MVKVEYDFTDTLDDCETLANVGATFLTVAGGLPCPNKLCQGKTISATVGRGSLALQGIQLHHVCHIEYLDAVNRALPTSLQLFVRDSPTDPIVKLLRSLRQFKSRNL